MISLSTIPPIVLWGLKYETSLSSFSVHFVLTSYMHNEVMEFAANIGNLGMHVCVCVLKITVSPM